MPRIAYANGRFPPHREAVPVVGATPLDEEPLQGSGAPH